MKSTFVKGSIAVTILVVLVCFLSCKKSTNVSVKSEFTWNYNGKSYTANIDSAFISSMSTGPILIASIGNNFRLTATSLQISVHSFAVGTYSFGTSTTNGILYVDELGFGWDAKTGSLNITENTGTRLSGHFSVMVTNGPCTITVPLSGTFKNVGISL